ncbi:hypothetical protein JCM10449v2_007692 [Rhodotorula kratochvilovae]
MHGSRTRPNPQQQHSHWAKQQELSAAYAALAVELTKTEIRSIGGYSLGRIIGEGTFGKVRLGVHRLTGTRVAIKQVPKSLPSYSPNDPSSPLSLLTREIHHHRRLRHPHVLALYELVATESSIYLVTELCSGGELFDYLVESCSAPPGQGGLALAETRRIFGQLVLGVAYLHGEGVVHRDLKLENVLLDENVNVKIADMGFGREFEKGRWLETKVGTLGYTAPEIVAGQRYLGEQVDIWSLGVILFALLTGSLPFDDDDESVMRSLILSCTYTIPSFLDPDAADLVSRILVADPLRRPSLREILAHPFFTRVPASGPEVTSLPSTTAPPLAPPVPAASSSAPPTPLGDPITPLASTSLSRSYFSPLPPSASSPSSSSPEPALSAIAAGKRRADAPALPPHVLPPSGAGSATPLRRHPSTASIDFGPSAPPVVRSLSSGGGGGGAGGVGALGQGAQIAGGGGGATVRRRKSGGAASARSLVLLGGAGAAPAAGAGDVDADAAAPQVDYLSLLSSSSSAPLLSTPADQALLRALARVGFDAGQVAHSVRTSACDACAAAWWMLRRKREEEEDEAREAQGEEAEGSARSVATEEKRRSALVAQPEEDGSSSDEDDGDVFTARVAVPATIAEERRPSVASASSSIAPPLTPPRRPSAGAPGTPSTPLADPSPAAAAARLSYFLQQSADPAAAAVAVGAVPLLSYFPPVDGAGGGSPSRPRAGGAVERSRSREALSAAGAGRSPGQEKPELPDVAPAPAPAPGTPDSARRRAGSIGMLARATSALGAGIASLSTGGGGGSAGSTGSSTPGEEPPLRPEQQRRASAVPAEEAQPRTPPLALTGAASGSAPSTPQHAQARTTTPPAPASPAARPPLPLPVPSSAGGGSGSPARSASEPAATTTSASVSASGSATRQAALSAASASGSSSSSASASFGRSTSLRFVPGSGSGSGSGSGGGKKGLKGANLLSTFKLWFGQSTDPRKRTNGSGGKRASLAAPPPPLSSTGVARSQSMYVGSPLRHPHAHARPGMGSRRSSQNSASGGGGGGAPYGSSVSRRSSVSSARGGGMDARTPRYGGAHQRRASDSSRTSASERALLALEGAGGGAGSRPASVRSFGAPPSARRHRHSKAPSGSSAASLKGLDLASSGASAGMYRRPPTTTTVRRRHGGSHGRGSSDVARTPGGGVAGHRRTQSSASSAHRSSGSDAAGAESDFEDEDDDADAGEAPILEEDEPLAEDAPPPRSHDAPSTYTYTPSPPPAFSRTRSSDRLPPSGSRPSSLRSGSPSSLLSRARAPAATFTAHKSTHLFGSPLQPRSTTSSTAALPARRVRDVFAPRAAAGGENDGAEWVDEDDDLAGYGGGLGQPAAGSAAAAGAAGRRASADAAALPAAAVDSPVASRVWEASAGAAVVGASMFEGRYAGLAAGGGAAGGTGVGVGAAAQANGGAQGRWARPAMVVEEEEEEEE